MPRFFDTIVEQSLLPQAVLTGLAGVFLHLALFIRGEWHNQAPFLFGLHLSLTAIILAIQLYTGQACTAALIRTGVILLSYMTGLFTSTTIYRLSPWHRLYRFPGPRLARVSKLWHVWQCRDSRNHELMQQLRAEYGDFVRIGERENSVLEWSISRSELC